MRMLKRERGCYAVHRTAASKARGSEAARHLQFRLAAAPDRALRGPLCRDEWESFEAHVRNYLEGTEFYRLLELVPKDMPECIQVDVEQIARDWECDYQLVISGDGGARGTYDVAS
jgi:hypothetical protein